MEFPTIDKFAKEVAEKALDEITYEGKTVREWVEIIVKQQPCEDCLSRESIINKIHALQDELTSNDDSKWNRNKLAFKYMAYVNGIILNEPSVYPERPNPDVVEKMKKAIDEMTEIHSDGEFYIKNVDAKWIIGKYLYGAEMSGGGDDGNNN